MFKTQCKPVFSSLQPNLEPGAVNLFKPNQFEINDWSLFDMMRITIHKLKMSTRYFSKQMVRDYCLVS